MANKVVISGLGLIGDFGAGRRAFLDHLLHKTEKKKIEDFNFEDYLDTGPLRKADNNSCFAAAAAKMAIDDARINMEEIPEERRGVVLGTTHGPLAYTVEYHKELIVGNPRQVSPLLFSNSVLNAMTSYLSTIFCARGYTTTITGYNAVLQAVKCGVDLIKEGALDVCLVGGVDTYCDILKESYSRCLDEGQGIGSSFGGSGILVLESLESVKKRRLKRYACIFAPELLAADHAKSAKYNISPIERLMDKHGLRLSGLSYAITSCYGNKESRKRQDLYLKDLKKAVFVADSSRLFGCTFSAAEAFEIALGVMSLEKEFNLPGVGDPLPSERPLDNVLVVGIGKNGSSGCLLLERPKDEI